jgi:hypothetical protein
MNNNTTKNKHFHRYTLLLHYIRYPLNNLFILRPFEKGERERAGSFLDKTYIFIPPPSLIDIPPPIPSPFDIVIPISIDIAIFIDIDIPIFIDIPVFGI